MRKFSAFSAYRQLCASLDICSPAQLMLLDFVFTDRLEYCGFSFALTKLSLGARKLSSDI